MRPVRLAPCAAGASPTSRSRAAGSPNPGTGRAQYVQARKRATLSRPTRSRCSTRRGQSRQRVRRRSSRRSAEEAVRVAMAAAANDPGAASGVLAPPSCGVPSGTPRRSSLRLPLSLPGSFASLTMATPTDSSDGLVCYAGNLDGYQNLGFLLRSFARVRARVPAARLVLVTHAAPGALRRAVGPGVEIVRAKSYDEVRARLDAADVVVSPRAERSGFPMKLLNYMAAGKAIVASAGSAKGLRDGVTGRIVPDGDEAAFAAAVIELLADAAARARLGAAARHAVEDPRAWDEVLDRIETVYRNVLAARSAARSDPEASAPDGLGVALPE